MTCLRDANPREQFANMAVPTRQAHYRCHWISKRLTRRKSGSVHTQNDMETT